MEPIQYVLDVRRNLVVNGSQPGIAIRQEHDRSGFFDSALPEYKTDCPLRLEAPIPHESKTGGLSLAIKSLARHDLKVALRSRGSVSDIPTVQANDQFLTRPVRQTGREDFRRFVKTFPYPHRPVAHGASSQLGRQG
jgi:hypothetical protein